MPDRTHRYQVSLLWTGSGEHDGASRQAHHQRSYELHCTGRPVIDGSASPAFRGDSQKWNPEKLLLGALCADHQLWFIHLCTAMGIGILSYADHAEGILEEFEDGSFSFTQVILRPHAALSTAHDVQQVIDLHNDAAMRSCIARSVRFPVTCEPRVTSAQ
ncbi:osmotically inducible protein OsmC [Komagataeibacter xylinus]|uniref:Osmotically inducible protein OsmC n=1 Tax=Komagataeibacter xylinus TaxID=28448 RepID=A0A318Q379_KOMXY|nr:OsmC family protein [Komagataeibacter xylinus]AZV38799.1 osmotically inducible protein OsmC [Komagataeibacter xylinus]PYD57159.1 osmotically inducible protein OsmC [Komagataeibacter xylinus]GBQ79479.1 OsmC-like protein [Komagataeibacter xylinus NBRC 15237]